MSIRPQLPDGARDLDPDPDPPGWGLLSELAGRLAGGVQPAVVAVGAARIRPLLRGAHVRDWHVLASELMSDGSTPPASDVSDHMGIVLADLAGSRARLLGCLYYPLDWARQLVTDQGSGSASDPLAGHRLWAMWCQMAEALWTAVSGELKPDGHSTSLSEVDRRLFHPLAARLRFLVLSEAFRHRDDGSSLWILPDDAPLGGQAPFTVVFGEDSWYLLVARARQARWIWKECLDTFESHPLLSQATPDQIEQEIDELLFCGTRPAGPLQITPDPLDGPQSAGPDDVAVRRDIAERHLLPRFRLGKTLRLAYRSGIARTDPGWQLSWVLPGITTGAAVLAGFALISGISAGVLGAAGRFDWALAAALGCYAMVGLGAVSTGPMFTLPWLLRWPASCALGMLALVGLNGDWWAKAAQTWPSVLVTGGLLAGAGYGYLLIEVRNHHVWGRPALRRACAVLGVGLWHATLVSLVGLIGILPTYAEGGAGLAGLFTNAHHGQACRVLVLTIAWCLAAGVFSQILWDDRPISAPLAHAGWRGGNDT
ncbi:MAG: hypothetical protein JXA67_15470 [Micromonosporaceae bacterium]|nr:hypothetical protein [Micromonosporaceae bacterium]